MHLSRCCYDKPALLLYHIVEADTYCNDLRFIQQLSKDFVWVIRSIKMCTHRERENKQPFFFFFLLTQKPALNYITVFFLFFILFSVAIEYQKNEQRRRI